MENWCYVEEWQIFRSEQCTDRKFFNFSKISLKIRINIWILTVEIFKCTTLDVSKKVAATSHSHCLCYWYGRISMSRCEPNVVLHFSATIHNRSLLTWFIRANIVTSPIWSIMATAVYADPSLSHCKHWSTVSEKHGNQFLCQHFKILSVRCLLKAVIKNNGDTIPY